MMTLKPRKSKKSLSSNLKSVKRKVTQAQADDDNREIEQFKKLKTNERATNKRKAHQDHPKKDNFMKPAAEKDGEKEKPNWNKIKQENKEKKLKRKQKDSVDSDIYELSVKLKQIWEEVRRENCEADRRKQLCKELYGLIKGRAKSLIFAHDTVRVIETLIGVGGEEYRSYLFVELKDELLNLCKNKYSRFFVTKLLRYGTREQKDAIMKAMEGHIASLMKHKIACDFVELAYNDYANAKQRSSMLQEFFGPRFRLFKEEIYTLAEALEKYPDSKERILKDIYSALSIILEKGVFTNILIHTLLKEYLYSCSKNERQTIIENIKEGLLPIIHTRDGARVAMICLWHSGAKDRKSIIKSFKGHYVKIATEEYAHMVLLAAFDCIDDTVLIKKIIFSELIPELDKLADNENGRKFLKYVVAPRHKLFFHPDVIAVLEGGDNNEFSKKDRNLKYEELRTGQNAMTDPILNLILKNIKEWVRDSHWTLFIGAALKSLSGNAVVPIFEAIADVCAEPYIPGEEKHFLESPFINKMVSYLIQTDKERHREGKALFSTHLTLIPESELRGWILSNRGCFILVRLYETEITEIVEHVTKICAPLKNKLQKLEFAGAGVLLKKLNP